MRGRHFSRREILRFFSVYAPTLMACGGAPNASTATGNSADVLVIGAGIAGLRAAEVLVKAGRRVIVLEGRERVGGRIWTDRSWGIPIELGASWIHSATNNAIAARAQAEGLEMLPFDYATALFGTDGKRRPDADMDAIRAHVDTLVGAAQANLSTDQPLRAALDAAIAAENLDTSARLDVEMGITAEIEQEFAADTNELSALSFDEDGQSESGGDVLLPGGYDKVVQAIARKVDIRLRTIVSAIDTTGDRAVVTTSQGSFDASAVIVTVPLGVLKAGTIAFSPALSARKQQAIVALGMGALSKTYLRFPSVFWPPEAEMLAIVRPADRHQQWMQSLSFSGILDLPLLLMFNAGSFARTQEAMSDEAALESAMTALRETFPMAPAPEAILRSLWTKDPFALGSYSYLAVGATLEDRAALAASEGRLFFAGEACSSEHAGSVHGAYASGEDAANAVLKG